MMVYVLLVHQVLHSDLEHAPIRIVNVVMRGTFVYVEQGSHLNINL